jgi:hypothetical protein
MAATDHPQPGHASHAGHAGPAAARRHALAAVDRDYPPWHAWPGVLAGVLYARRPGTSPPMVVRSATPDGLRAEIERAEHQRGLRP